MAVLQDQLNEMEYQSMNTIKINQCQGYLWLSNQQKPEVFQNEKFEKSFDETKNPFVVEGQLYDVDKKKSYSIKFVDGKYLIKSFDVTDDDFRNPYTENKKYLSNRMGDRWLKFLRYWEPREDKNCLGMPVLTLTKNVFVGFKE